VADQGGIDVVAVADVAPAFMDGCYAGTHTPVAGSYLDLILK
jgi:hypothetical protein